MARGGARKGAGRKPGVPNKRTRALQDAVEASGITPLEVMISIMRWAHDEGGKLIAACHKTLEDNDADEKLRAYFEDGKHLKVLALDAASRAAPFVHGRIATAEPSRQTDAAPEPQLPSEDRLAEMRKRYAPHQFQAIPGGRTG